MGRGVTVTQKVATNIQSTDQQVAAALQAATVRLQRSASADA